MNSQEILTQFANLIYNTKTKLSINQAYFNMLEYSKTRCRAGTIEYYQKVYNSFKMWFSDNNIKFVEDINKQNLTRYVSYLKTVKEYKNSSINKHIEVIKHICKYNFDNELSSANNISNFKKLKNDTLETITIQEKKIFKILDYLNNLNLKNIVTLRNVLTIFLLKDTGARINEILHIECKNISLETNRILLSFTKTGYPRKVYLSSRTIELLTDYLSRPELEDSKFLLINFQTKEIVFKSTIYFFINQIKEDLNINNSISPHKWRHTLASTLVNQNVNVSIVQKVLGHTSLEITKRYLHAEEDFISKSVLNVLEQKKDTSC